MMDARRWQSPAAAAAAAEAAEEDAGGGGSGVGGPSRRPPRRGLHRASPYGLGPRRWLPKLPTASRIFPAVPRDCTSSDNNQLVQRESLEVANQSKSTEPNTSSTNAVPALVNNKTNPLLEGDYKNRNDGSAFGEIEKIIKQNHFSRYETERLIEIMRSRTPELHEEDQRAHKSFTEAVEATTFSYQLTTPAKSVGLQSAWGGDVFTPSNVHDDSSPVELAKAYMEAQASATAQESQRRKFRALSHGVEIQNQVPTFFPKVAADTPVHWPGSVVRDYPNYRTPQSNKRRSLPPISSRTPYTGSLFPRTVKQKQSHLDSYNNSPGQAGLSTPPPVGSKAMLEDKMASTGSVLGVQPSTSSRRAYADTVGDTTTLFQRDGSAAMKNVTFSLQAPHDKDTIGSGSKRAAVSVHPKSSQTANKILQHLERAIPSPTAKPLELRQSPAKRISPSVSTNSQYKEPDYTSNGARQSSTNEGGNVYQALSDTKKVQEPPSSSNAEKSSPKVEDSRADPEVTETTSSQHPAPAAMALDKVTYNGFAFTFPVTKASVSLQEPPPTPTLFSPPRSLPVDAEEIPKFTFGSSGSTNSLVFSFDSASSSVGADETAPTFKFGSGKKRELSFDIAGKDAVCF